MYVYHVVTDRPMHVGQQIIFDESHHSGVYQKVYDKLNIVNDIYATKCFKGQLSKEENLKLAEIYWESEANVSNPQAVREMLVDGYITVVELVKEINANIGGLT